MLSLLYALPRKSQAVRGKFTERKGLPSVARHYCFRKNQTLLVPRRPDRPANGSPFGSNGDDRRQRRKQGGVVGAAASRMQATAKQTLGAATRAVALRSNDGEGKLLSREPPHSDKPSLVREMPSQCLRFPVSALALSGASRQLSQRESRRRSGCISLSLSVNLWKMHGLDRDNL